MSITFSDATLPVIDLSLLKGAEQNRETLALSLANACLT